MLTFEPGVDFAVQLDAEDPLAAFRDLFVLTEPELIYMDGNSLGRQPQSAVRLMEDLLRRQWGDRLIRSWNEGWMEMQARIGAKIGRLIGAAADEVIIADATSINLFKLALAAINFQQGRNKIVTDDLNFPSDLYILQGVLRLVNRPLQIEVVPSPDGIHGPMEGLAAAIDQETALVTLSHTVFKSAYMYDLTAVTEMAHRTGALILWDMSPSVGSVPADLNTAGADLAVGCTYKYLNGGPGSPAFLFIRRDWQAKLGNPITGWMGQNNMFDFDLAYQRDPGLRHFLTGTPPILSTALIEPGVDLLLAAGMEKVRAKSIQQSEYLIYLWQSWLAPLGFRLNSPLEPAVRGSHVSLGHDAGWGIDQALIHDMGVIPDFRQPDNIRLGIAPLYTSFRDIHTAVWRLKQVVEEKLYEKYQSRQMAVS